MILNRPNNYGAANQFDGLVTGQKNDDASQKIPVACEEAKRILRERVRNKQKEYFVLFADGSKHWADFVTPCLLQHYWLLQEKRRQRKRNGLVRKINRWRRDTAIIGSIFRWSSDDSNYCETLKSMCT